MNNAGLTDRQVKILRYLGCRAVLDLPPETCREISTTEFGRYQTWALRDLRALELRKFVDKARPDQFNNIRWKITDAGLERLTRDTGNQHYRGAQRRTGGTPPSP